MIALEQADEDASNIGRFADAWQSSAPVVDEGCWERILRLAGQLVSPTMQQVVLRLLSLLSRAHLYLVSCLSCYLSGQNSGVLGQPLQPHFSKALSAAFTGYTPVSSCTEAEQSDIFAQALCRAAHILSYHGCWVEPLPC